MNINVHNVQNKVHKIARTLKRYEIEKNSFFYDDIL
jgi:hypothetical protein